jgi:hypothetical protein
MPLIIAPGDYDRRLSDELDSHDLMRVRLPVHAHAAEVHRAPRVLGGINYSAMTGMMVVAEGLGTSNLQPLGVDVAGFSRRRLTRANGDDSPLRSAGVTRFITTTRQSAPNRRIGTFGFVVVATCAFSLASPCRFSRSVQEPDRDSRLLYAGMWALTRGVRSYVRTSIRLCVFVFLAGTVRSRVSLTRNAMQNSCTVMCSIDQYRANPHPEPVAVAAE